MTDTPEQQAERRLDLVQRVTDLAAKLERHIEEELPMVAQLGEKIAEIRTEQRIVHADLVREQRATLTRVQDDQAVMRSKLDANTEITQEVRDILATFKMLGSFAKWGAAIVAAVAGAWAAVKGLRP